jgi:hypothetical protein
MTNGFVKFLCFASLTIFVLARVYQSDAGAAKVSSLAQPAITKLGAIVTASKSSDLYVKLEQIKKIIPATAPGINRFIQTVHDEKDLESDASVPPAAVPAAGVPAHKSAYRPERTVVVAVKRQLKLFHRAAVFAVPPMPWRDAFRIEAAAVIAYFTSIPLIAYGVLAGFILGLFAARSPNSRRFVRNNLPASYFAHKSPIRVVATSRPSPAQRPRRDYGSPALRRPIPTGARLVPAGDGVRRYIEI